MTTEEPESDEEFMRQRRKEFDELINSLPIPFPPTGETLTGTASTI